MNRNLRTLFFKKCELFTFNIRQPNLNYKYFSMDTSNSKIVYKERQLVGYSREKMFELVKDVSKYKEFVPWCLKSDILQSTVKTPNQAIKDTSLKIPRTFTAELEIGFPPIKQAYVSHVTYIKPSFIKSISHDMTIFEFLDAEWRFYLCDKNNKQILTKEDTINAATDCCVIEFSVSFKFRSILYSKLADLFLDNVFKQMVNAFLSRAAQLYGKPVIKNYKINLNSIQSNNTNNIRKLQN